MNNDDSLQSTEECTAPIFVNGRYKNPWSTWVEPGFLKLIKFLTIAQDDSAIPKKEHELQKTLPVLKPDFEGFDNSPKNGIRHMWIGHASSLVQLDGITLLTDPVFSDRCAPFQWMGPKRYRPPPCTIADLPRIDCVVISHNHYDHLDYNSVMALHKRFGDNLRWYVPMGLKHWMNNCGCKNVVEMTWWQEHVHSESSRVKFVCTPCQHWCKRTATDTNKALWSSWCIIGPKHKFYFTGDSGYCEGFKQIGRKYGPFNLATIPIGAYQPDWFLTPQHISPEEAVSVHQDIKSEQSIGIHWGTFNLSREHYLEPQQKLKEALKKHGLLPSSFVTVSHGEVSLFSKEEE